MTLRDLLRAWRWLLNVECSEPFCHQRRICWRWHVETTTCPTCKRTATEGGAAFDQIAFDALMRAQSIPIPIHITTGPTQTWTTTSYAERCPCNPANGGSGVCGCVLGNQQMTY